MTSRLIVIPAGVFLSLISMTPQTSWGQRVYSQVAHAAPPRDQRPQTQPTQNATAAIRGRVVAADTGRPLRRARIQVSSPELGRNTRTASTNADGQYEIKDLPAGRYTVSVTRGGYLTLLYGQRRPFEQGKPLQVLDRQVIDHIDFALPKMSLISGRITDEAGDPIEGAVVVAMRSTYLNGQRRLVGVGQMVRTDDAGSYRITGLSPGSYVVLARTNDKWTLSVGDHDETMGYAPTYFPGTTNAEAARKLSLGLGGEASATDFSLIPGRGAKVSGTATDSHGRPFTNVTLSQETRTQEGGAFYITGSTSVAPDGTFTIVNVTPGEYLVGARTVDKPSSDETPEVALVPIVLDGVDIADVALMGSSGGSMQGHLVTDGGTLPKTARVQIRLAERVVGQPSPILLGAFKTPGIGQVNDDGTFTVNNVFGRVRFDITLPEGWAVRAILHQGRDITDLPVELKSREEWSGVQVLLTNQFATVTNRMVDAKGTPITDGTVIVFAADSSKWFEGSRFVRAARPDQQGQAQIKGLPPGEYLAVAVDYVENGLWYDPDYLDSIRHSAERFMVSEGESRSLSLKLVTAQ